MEYLDLFERRGRAMDDLLLAASMLAPETFGAPGPANGPSLRDLFLAWLEEERRAVHATLRDGAYTPLPLAAHGGFVDIARAFGGFRLTFRETLEATTPAELARRVTWKTAAGKHVPASVDEVLSHLALHDARMQGLIAERLRQLGADVPDTGLLA